MTLNNKKAFSVENTPCKFLKVDRSVNSLYVMYMVFISKIGLLRLNFGTIFEDHQSCNSDG